MLGLLMAPASGLMFGGAFWWRFVSEGKKITFLTESVVVVVVVVVGAVRSKNTLTALTHALTIFVIVSVTWFMYGFSISFGPSINGIGFVGTPGEFC